MAELPIRKGKRRCRPRLVGDVNTRWLEDDVNMELTSSVAFIDSRCTFWEARKGLVMDGASVWVLLDLPVIGWLVRMLIGGDPYSGPHRIPAAFHDQAYEQLRRVRNARLRRLGRKRADLMYYECCRFRGSSWLSAGVMHAFLRWFGWLAVADKKEGVKE